MKKRVVISEPERLERFMHSFNENHSEERYAAPVQGVSDSFHFKFRHYTSTASYENPDDARLTLKLNRTNINPIIATLERFGYDIEEAHANDPVESIDQERLDMLLRYLAT